jgi:hypothetical protein
MVVYRESQSRLRRCPLLEPREWNRIHTPFTLSTTRMPDIPTIQFTQDQARTLTGVSVETVRHWRRAIPYLAGRTGKAARFSFADVVALAVTHELVNVFRVHIGTISGGVDGLFRLLAERGAGTLEGAIVCITATQATLQEADDAETGLRFSEAAIMVPLTPVLVRIQRHMLPTPPVAGQSALPFPPAIVRRRA